VIVELGGNDFLRKHPDDQVKEDLGFIVKSIRASGAIPVLLAVPHLSLLRATTGTLSDADLYRELADEKDVLLIEDVFSDVLSDDNLRADPIHPNARGYKQLTEGIIVGLRSAGLLP
jgi:acyl-CoA hydrolase